MFLPYRPRFDRQGLGAAIDMGDGSVHRLDTIFADFIDLDRRLFRALGGVVRHHFGAFGQPVKGVFATHLGCLDAVDGGLVDKLDGCSVPSLVLTTAVLVAESSLVMVPWTALTTSCAAS
jgi:hypothetical protein